MLAYTSPFVRRVVGLAVTVLTGLLGVVYVPPTELSAMPAVLEESPAFDILVLCRVLIFLVLVGSFLWKDLDVENDSRERKCYLSG